MKKRHSAASKRASISKLLRQQAAPLHCSGSQPAPEVDSASLQVCTVQQACNLRSFTETYQVGCLLLTQRAMATPAAVIPASALAQEATRLSRSAGRGVPAAAAPAGMKPRFTALNVRISAERPLQHWRMRAYKDCNSHFPIQYRRRRVELAVLLLKPEAFACHRNGTHR